MCDYVISIHAPLAGSDFLHVESLRKFTRFQSTLPSRGATYACVTVVLALLFQSTLPSRGATSATPLFMISLIFQSTLPSRGATLPSRLYNKPSSISIHAPLAGSDATRDGRFGLWGDFNPRSPRGERPTILLKLSHGWTISIHAPLAGSDRISSIATIMRMYFNPRSPRGERPHRREADFRPHSFQSTLPSRGATSI